jgi:hypothetical protein
MMTISVAQSDKDFATCNADALAAQSAERAALYARRKLAGLDSPRAVKPSNWRSGNVGFESIRVAFAIDAACPIHPQHQTFV